VAPLQEPDVKSLAYRSHDAVERERAAVIDDENLETFPWIVEPRQRFEAARQLCGSVPGGNDHRAERLLLQLLTAREQGRARQSFAVRAEQCARRRSDVDDTRLLAPDGCRHAWDDERPSLREMTA
jgi:hypothetical protein